MSLSPLAFSPRNAAVLAFWTRSSRATSGPTAARSSVDPQCDGGLLRLSRSWDPRRRCNHGCQCDFVSTTASSESHRCNVQRPARATGDKWIQRAILQNGTRPCLRVAGGSRSDAVRRARSDRERETHSNAQKKLTPRRAHTYHHAGSSASRSGTRSTWATTSTTRSSRMR